MLMRRYFIYIFFFAALACNTAFWFYGRAFQATWTNVPPVPTDGGSAVMALGDRQFSYRSTGMMLQNLGNMGGRAIPLKEYDFKRLGQWFFLADRLDPRSIFMPFLAAYYFGAAQEGTDITPVIDYLEEIGMRPEEQNWRWLAQAVFLARYRMNDLGRALELAGKLSAQWKPGRPGWMKQMQAFILMEKGDQEAAYELLIRLIKEESGALHPEEINSMVGYLCRRVLDPLQAAVHPLCTKVR